MSVRSEQPALACVYTTVLHVCHNLACVSQRSLSLITPACLKLFFFWRRGGREGGGGGKLVGAGGRRGGLFRTNKCP